MNKFGMIFVYKMNKCEIFKNMNVILIVFGGIVLFCGGVLLGICLGKMDKHQ